MVHSREGSRFIRCVGHGAGEVYGRHPCFLQAAANAEYKIEPVAALLIFFGRKAHQHRVVLTYLFAYLLHYLQQQAHSRFFAASVIIRPLVGSRREELVYEVAVRRVHLHCIESCLNTPSRCQRETSLNIFYVFKGHLPGCIRCGGSNGDFSNGGSVRGPAGMVKLDANLAAFCVYGLHQLSMSCQHGIVV